MKTNKILKITANIIGALVLLGFSGTAFAATTVVLSPTSFNTNPGKTFTVNISVDTGSLKNYAEKIELGFPADLLEVKSFDLAPSWMALTATGYDSIDNTNGVLVKSAGFPGGLSGVVNFGTITFSAKKVGSASIKVGSGSQYFDSSSQFAMGGNEVAVTVTLPALTATPVHTTSPAPVKTTVTAEVSAQSNPANTTLSPESSNQTASIIRAFSGNFRWLWSLVALIIVGGVVYYFIRKNKTV